MGILVSASLSAATRPRTLLLVGVLLLLFVFGGISPAYAQEKTGDNVSKSELNIQVGNLLPDQIDGVTEILPMWGVFYNMPVAGAGLEFGFLDAHGKGVDYVQVPLRGRLDVPFDNFLTVIAYAGPELNYYTPIGASTPNSVVGFHVGGGGVYHILENLCFRAEMKFSVNPGDSLYFGFGITWRGQ